MRINVRSIILIIIAILAIVIGARAFQKTGKMSADVEKQADILEQSIQQ